MVWWLIVFWKLSLQKKKKKTKNIEKEANEIFHLELQVNKGEEAMHYKT